MTSETSNKLKCTNPPKGKTEANLKLSKTSQDIQKKWQEESLKRGGGATLVLKQHDAKQLIYNLMKDNFKPMNITMIYEVRTIVNDGSLFVTFHPFYSLVTSYSTTQYSYRS